MPRKFQHSGTGREVVVAEGSRMEALVEADANYTEVDAPVKKTAAKKTTKK